MKLIRALGTVGLLILATQAHALSVKIVDQNNRPVSRAAVIIPSIGVEKQIAAAPAVMDQINKRFSPEILAVQAGTPVSFPNSDSIRHHVYSFSKPKTFELKLYSGVPSSPIVFDQPGVVVLGCNIHDSMVGYILVVDHQFVRLTNDQGMVELEDIDSLPQLNIWHPLLRRGITQPVVISADKTQSAAPKTIAIELRHPAIKDQQGVREKTGLGNHFQRYDH